MSKTLIKATINYMSTKTNFYHVSKVDLAYLKHTPDGVVPAILHKGSRVHEDSVEGKYFKTLGLLSIKTCFSLYKEEITTTLME